MQKNILINLDWLKRPDQEFDEIIKNLKDSGINSKILEKLNPYYIDIRRSDLINKKISLSKNQINNSGVYTKFNLGIISNVNVEFFLPSLKAYSLKNYINLSCYPAPFGQTLNFLKDKNNSFLIENIDAVFVCIDFSCFNYGGEKSVVKDTFRYIKEIVDLVNSQLKIPCIIQNMVNSVNFLYGSLDFLMEDTHRSITWEVNNLLREELKKNNYNILFDADKLSSVIGLDLWCDQSIFNLAKVPLSRLVIPTYAYYLSNIIGSIKGKSKRLIIVDLDNTLWGGNVGDVGIENLELGHSSGLGEAYLNFQKYLLSLRERGVILAVASKNNQKTALDAINNHPEMLIKEEHISAHEINWKDKAQNILNICNKVRLGAQSAVFIDDNPFERDLVRNFLPSISIPELPNDPSYFTKFLSSANYFETTFFSDDDKIRSNFFLAEKKRLNLKEHYNSIDKYLVTLKMKGIINSFKKIDIKRLEQLINKSNQFNLTTKRYSYKQIEDICKNKDYITIQLRLSDIYGQNGIIAIVILKLNNDNITIDTWIQSCRILERKVELFILDNIIEIAKKNNCKSLFGEYIKTSKNHIVKEHYKKLGFVKEKNQNPETWKLDIQDYKKPSIPITKDSFSSF